MAGARGDERAYVVGLTLLALLTMGLVASILEDDSLLRRLLPLAQELDGPGEVNVGTVLYRSSENDYLGTLIFARGAAADTLARTLAALDVAAPPPDVPVEGVDGMAVRRAICQEAPEACRSVRESVLENLSAAQANLSAIHGFTPESNVTSDWYTRNETLVVLHLSRGELGAPREPAAPSRLIELDNVTRYVGVACSRLAGETSCPPVSNYSVFASTRGGWWRYADLAHPAATTVLGPLAWRGEPLETLVGDHPGAGAAAERVSLEKRLAFLPMSGLLAIAVGLAGLVPFYGAIRWSGCATVRPALLYALLLAALLLVLMQAGALAFVGGWVGVLALFALLYVALFVLYWTKTPGRVHYLAMPVAAAVVAVAAAFAAELLDAAILERPEQLLLILYGAPERQETGLHRLIVPLGLATVAAATLPGLLGRARARLLTRRYLAANPEAAPLARGEPGTLAGRGLASFAHAGAALQAPESVRIHLLRREMEARRARVRAALHTRIPLSGAWKEWLHWRVAHLEATHELRRLRRQEPPGSRPHGFPLEAHEVACRDLLVAYRQALQAAKAKLPGID